MIRSYSALQGQGKTFSAVYDAYMVMKRGLRVVSNTPIIVKRKKDIIMQSILLEGQALVDDLLSSENTLYLIDEGGIMFDQYNWKRLDPTFRKYLISHRKYGNHIFYTTVDFHDVVPIFRRYTAQAVLCKKTIIPLFPYVQIYYRRQFMEFEAKDMNIETEKKYILKRKFISLPEREIIYKIYNHKYVIDDSLFVDTKHLRQPSTAADENKIGKYI